MMPVPKSVILIVGIAFCVLAKGQDESGLDGKDTPRHRATFSDNLKSGGKGPLMAMINGGGRFNMGCVSGVRCLFNEPVHEVLIKHPFAMSVYEITRGDFRQFVEQTGYLTDAECPDIPRPIGTKPVPELMSANRGRYKRYCANYAAEDVRALGADGMRSARGEHLRLRTWRNPGFEQSDEYPVVCISWSDAKEYVRWLADETDRPYRLPSEAEWEFAARAGPPSMEGYDDPSAWCDHNNPEPCVLNFLDIQPEGANGPNALGIFGIGSNIAEWTEDCWNRDFRNAPVDGSAWLAGRCSRRVLRDVYNVRSPPFHELRWPSEIHMSGDTGIRVAASPIH